MRILTLSNCPLVETQGSGYVILGYARELAARGHVVDLVDPRELEIPRGGLRAIRYRQMLGMAWTALRRAHRYDLLEIYGGEGWLAVEMLRRRKNRPLLVAHSNGLEPRASHALAAYTATRPRWQLDHSRLFARGFRGVDALVTVSEYDRAFALAQGYQEPERVLALDNPLPASYLRLSLDLDRPPVLVWCGSWIARKGIEVLVAGTNEFLRRFPEWRLRLAGVEAGFCVAEVFAPDVAPRVEALGSLDRERGLREVYLGARIAVQTSVYESFGLAAAEAMACGAALVATPVGFAAGLEPDREVMMVPVGDAQTLVLTLSELARNDGRRLELARHGYRRVQRLDWASAGARLESTYTHWLEAHTRSAAGRIRP